MNSENLRRVADAIEKHEIEWLGFNMDDWLGTLSEDKTDRDCGTTAYIAGWTYVLFSNAPTVKNKVNHVEGCKIWQFAADKFAVVYEAEELFLGRPSYIDESDQVTPQMAVNTLRYAADHGIVDWDAANPVKDPAP